MRAPALLLALAAAPALAQSNVPPPSGPNQPPPGPRPTIVAEPVALTIAAFDADQDGLVTRAELTAGAARSFASVAKGAPDIGYIGYSDWALRWLGDANALPSPFDVDTDHNDRITLAELTAALTRAFNRFDVNKDGVLSRAELVTLRSTQFGDGYKPDGKKDGKRGEGRPRR